MGKNAWKAYLSFGSCSRRQRYAVEALPITVWYCLWEQQAASLMSPLSLIHGTRLQIREARVCLHCHFQLFAPLHPLLRGTGWKKHNYNTMGAVATESLAEKPSPPAAIRWKPAAIGILINATTGSLGRCVTVWRKEIVKEVSPTHRVVAVLLVKEFHPHFIASQPGQCYCSLRAFILQEYSRRTLKEWYLCRKKCS